MMGDVGHTLLAIAPRLNARCTDPLRPQNTTHTGNRGTSLKVSNPAREELPDHSNSFQLLCARVKPRQSKIKVNKT